MLLAITTSVINAKLTLANMSCQHECVCVCVSVMKAR